MKKALSILLAIAALLCCTAPALAANETTGSTEISITLPLESPSNPSEGSGSNAEDDPPYSYVVNIPASFAITTAGNTFSITASEMNIPEDKQVVVRVDSAATFDPDGNFYLYLNGDKNGNNYFLCHIDRVQNNVRSSVVMGPDNVVASFKPGNLKPYDWDFIRIITVSNDIPGTYSNTIHYTISIE